MARKRLRLLPELTVGVLLPLSTLVQIEAAQLAPIQVAPILSDNNMHASLEESELTALRKQLLGLWQGRYICVQGETGLDLTITDIDEGYLSGDLEIKATFTFYNLPGRNNSKEGSFSMLGHLNPHSFNLKLEPNSWIERPSGYKMVSIDALVNIHEEEIRGSIESGGCSAMRVEHKKASP